jgi:signal recognition particle subunit SRP54
MLEDLSSKIDKVLKKITGQGKITEDNIAETLREIRRILLDADVNYKVAKQFVEEVSRKALGQEVLKSLSPAQQITKIIYDELTQLLGGTTSELILSDKLNVILIVGLQGSGKTTFSAKLANYLKKSNKKVGLVACDIYRPAAIEQLKVLGKQIDVPVYASEEKDPIKIAADAVVQFKTNGINNIIIDTAGRLHVDQQMMDEVVAIKEKVSPSEILFVVDSMTGQDAVNSAKAFVDAVDYTGIVLTKLDGDTKGGCALSIRAVVQKPIKFISLGEKLNTIEVFHPDRLASRILGKGDVITLVEKVQAEIDEEEAKKLENKLKNNKFDFEDFLSQIKMIKKMGSLSSLMKMIPGVSNALNGVNVDDKALIRIEAIINSMTKEERKNPKILNGRRRLRIAKGSGTSVQEVNKLVKQFEEMQKMMKMFSNKRIANTFMNKMGLKF